MTNAPLAEQDWQIRLAIYQFFVEQARPPQPAEIASQRGITEVEARAAYQRLHANHAIFLEPGTDSIRMASPLSAVPTPYRVHVDGHDVYANCAWDSLGIPAMLRADAAIDAHDTLAGVPIQYAVTDGQLVAEPGLLVHFAVPFKHWYDDLIHT